MALPIIPHTFFGVDCCGYLVEIVREHSEFACNECWVSIPLADVQRAVMEMPSTYATCPHCGKANNIIGFLQVLAFLCHHCGRGVTAQAPSGGFIEALHHTA